MEEIFTHLIRFGLFLIMCMFYGRMYFFILSITGREPGDIGDTKIVKQEWIMMVIGSLMLPYVRGEFKNF